ncbi:MAG: nuclear transport factor 2 family protein [Acidobacteriota bacterium]|nr:nuclear transport factor 2 family protein [Acidobacteriota bacterium]
MNKTIALVTLITMTALLVSGQTSRDRRVEDEIRRLNAQEVEALLRNDVAMLRRLWSDDFVVTNPFNRFINKPQILGLAESGNLAFTSYDRQIEYVRIYGDTAVVAGSETVVWAGRMPTAGQTSRLRFTAIWMRQGGRWQEVARHANIIVQQ